MKILTTLTYTLIVLVASCKSSSEPVKSAQSDSTSTEIDNSDDSSQNSETTSFGDKDLDSMANDLRKSAAVDYHTKWLRKANSGDSDAMFEVGSQFYDGYGCEQSYEEAFLWWLKSAKLGDYRAMNNVGHCYRNELGTVKD